ncbi:MAG: NfeD family protein [Bacteroidota bacterium]
MELLIPALLLVVGLGLIAAEVYFVPGVNVVGILGVLTMIFGVGYAFTTSGFAGGLIALVTSVALAAALGFLAYKSGAWDRFVLKTTVGPDLIADKAQENRARYLGQLGKAITPLRPTGVAEIAGERVEVVTEGAFIASGSEVKVVALDRRRLFVRLADTAPVAR